MNPAGMGMPPPSPMDEEFVQKEKEVTDAVIQVIAMAKKENQEILNEETKAVVVEACKQAVAQTMAFQNTMKGADPFSLSIAREQQPALFVWTAFSLFLVWVPSR